MTSEQIIAFLKANAGKRVRITFDDGAVQSVAVDSVDDEGFLHSGPNGGDPQACWTRFEGVKLIQSDKPD